MSDTPRDADADPEPESPTASGPSLPAELVDPSAGPVGADGDDEDDGAFSLGELLGGGGLDLGNLMEQATQMQQQMASAQEEAAATLLEGTAGGGAVRIGVTGAGRFLSVHIDPAAVDPSDVAMVEDLVLVALNDAAAQVEELNSQAMGDLGDIGGLLGGPS